MSRPTAVLACLTVTLSLGIAACGDDDSDEAGQKAPASATTPSEKKTPVKGAGKGGSGKWLPTKGK